MGRIVVHEFITLDGVIDAPAWSMEYGFDPKMGDAIGRIMQSSKALLLGRNTYELFAPSWSTRTAAEDPGAPFMNESPKYVVSSTLQNVGWNNSTVLGAYSAEAIGALKQQIDGDIYVSGSGTLVRAMLADGLVDELHLFVFPLAMGAGPRLFSDGRATKFESRGNRVLRQRRVAPGLPADHVALRGRLTAGTPRRRRPLEHAGADRHSSVRSYDHRRPRQSDDDALNRRFRPMPQYLLSVWHDERLRRHRLLHPRGAALGRPGRRLQRRAADGRRLGVRRRPAPRVLGHGRALRRRATCR